MTKSKVDEIIRVVDKNLMDSRNKGEEIKVSQAMRQIR